MSRTVVIRLLKDVGAEFGCKGDVYVNTEEQMAALDARVSKFKLGKAYEEVKATAADDGKTSDADKSKDKSADKK